jgi:hypothetical protein
LTTAIQIASITLPLLEVPLWPSFRPDTTAEDITLQAVTTEWFYIKPIALLVMGR